MQLARQRSRLGVAWIDLEQQNPVGLVELTIEQCLTSRHQTLLDKGITRFVVAGKQGAKLVAQLVPFESLDQK